MDLWRPIHTGQLDQDQSSWYSIRANVHSRILHALLGHDHIHPAHHVYRRLLNPHKVCTIAQPTLPAASQPLGHWLSVNSRTSSVYENVLVRGHQSLPKSQLDFRSIHLVLLHSTTVRLLSHYYVQLRLICDQVVSFRYTPSLSHLINSII